MKLRRVLILWISSFIIISSSNKSKIIPFKLQIKNSFIGYSSYKLDSIGNLYYVLEDKDNIYFYKYNLTNNEINEISNILLKLKDMNNIDVMHSCMDGTDYLLKVNKKSYRGYFCGEKDYIYDIFLESFFDIINKKNKILLINRNDDMFGKPPPLPREQCH